MAKNYFKKYTKINYKKISFSRHECLNVMKKKTLMRQESLKADMLVYNPSGFTEIRETRKKKSAA